MYSDFYEIPLPALRFEKVEEIDIKVNKILKKGTTLSERHAESTTSEKERRAHFTVHGKDLRIKDLRIETAERTTFKEDTTLPENRKTTSRNDVNQTLSRTVRRKNDVNNDAHSTSQTTTRI